MVVSDVRPFALQRKRPRRGQNAYHPTLQMNHSRYLDRRNVDRQEQRRQTIWPVPLGRLELYGVSEPPAVGS